MRSFGGLTGLKDGPFATMMLAMAAIALRPLDHQTPGGRGRGLGVGFPSRPVMGVVGLAMLVVPVIELVRGRWRGRMRPVRTGSRLLVLLLGLPTLALCPSSLAAAYLPALKVGLAGEPSPSLGTAPMAISFSPSGFDLLHALLSPVPFGPGSYPVSRALWPGMVVWYVMLPTVALGCCQLLRRGSWAARGVVMSALAFLYLYVAVLQDQAFPRQRSTVEILLLVVGLYAYQRLPHWAAVWTAVGVCIIAPAALVQAGALRPVGLALVASALGAMWLAKYSAPLARVRRATGGRGGLQNALGWTRANGRRNG